MHFAYSLCGEVNGLNIVDIFLDSVLFVYAHFRAAYEPFNIHNIHVLPATLTPLTHWHVAHI